LIVAGAEGLGSTVVLFHPGGFANWSSTSLTDQCRVLSRAGYRAISVDYPLGNYRSAVAYARRVVTRRALAVGWSSGGTLVAQLAIEGRIRGAVVVSAPTDFMKWGTAESWAALGVAPTERAGLSPVNEAVRHRVPVLALYSREDKEIHYSQGVRFANRVHAKLLRVHGCHLCSMFSGEDLPVIVRWLGQH